MCVDHYLDVNKSLNRLNLLKVVTWTIYSILHPKVEAFKISLKHQHELQCTKSALQWV